MVNFDDMDTLWHAFTQMLDGSSTTFHSGDGANNGGFRRPLVHLMSISQTEGLKQ